MDWTNSSSNYCEVPEIQPDIRKKLAEYVSFADGWNFGEGARFSQRAISATGNCSQYGLALGMEKQDCFPGLAGEIMLVFYEPKHQIELTVDPCGKIDVLVDSCTESVEEIFDLSVDKACTWLGTWSRKRWIWSGSSIFDTTMQNMRDALTVSPWGQGLAQASQFLTPVVRKDLAALSAGT